jgi:chemotaxis response regulator CheB
LPRHTAFDVVAVAASAGGVSALNMLLDDLPANFAVDYVVPLQDISAKLSSLVNGGGAR